MIYLPLVLGAALLASPYKPLTVAKSGDKVSALCGKDRPVEAKTTAGSDGRGVAYLPFAMGKRFESLDAYLAHLRCRAAPIDLPWWREVAPGVYQQVKRAPDAKSETATRAELMERFGFSR